MLCVILPPSSQWITQRAQKKQTKYLHLIKKIFIPLPYITKNIRSWKKQPILHRDKPMRLANRTGGAA